MNGEYKCLAVFQISYIVTLEWDSLCGRSTATLLIISTYYVTENL